MKKGAVLFLAIGWLGGFAIGHVSKPKPAVASDPVAPPAVAPVAAAEPDATPRPQERELLLQAIQELDLTAAELDEANAYIQKLERNTKRYDWLMGYWKEKGFGATYSLNINSFDGFAPREDLVAFFGWNDEQVEQIKQAGQRTSEATKTWESDHSVCIEDSAEKLVYEIEGVPPEISKTYLQAMAEIIDPDDFALLESSMEDQFESKSQARIATLTIGPAPEYMAHFTNHDPGQEYMHIRIDPKEKNQRLPGSGTSYFSQPYTPGVAPFQWNHVFKMEGDEGFEFPLGTMHSTPRK